MSQASGGRLCRCGQAIANVEPELVGILRLQVVVIDGFASKVEDTASEI